MKNKTLALFGIGTYVLSVIVSATDLEGNPVMPLGLIAISGLASTAFIVLAIIRLWKSANHISMTLAVSSALLVVFVFLQFALPQFTWSMTLVNLTKMINFIAFIWAIIKLFKLNDFSRAPQRDLVDQESADQFYRNNSELALQIALGKEKAPSGLSAAAIYAKVCEEAERSNNVELCRQIANSLDNFEISAEARKLKLTKLHSAIEYMKDVVNARVKEIEKTLPKGKTIRDAINKEIKELKKWVMFLENYFQALVETEEGIEEEIKEIEIDSQQPLKKKQMGKELWILRYACSHLWFFHLREPKNANELKEDIKLITYAFEKVLRKYNKSDYLPWLTKGLDNYLSPNELNSGDLEKIQADFAERMAERIPLIAFECTEGRLGGKQHDSVIALIQATLETDKNIFESDKQFDSAA